MNRKELVKAFREEGYAEATPTLDSLKAYAEANGIVFKDADGVVDLAEAWDTKSEVVIKDAAQPARQSNKANSDAAKKAFGEVAKVVEEGESKAAPQRFAIGNIQKSMFKAKIARGETYVKDADAAEVMGAFFRVETMKAAGVESWDGKSRDLDIVKAMTTYDNSAAGNFVPPPELMNELIYNGEPTGVARKVANVVRMGNSQVAYTRETADITFAAVAEGAALPAITPATDQINLYPRKYGGYFESSWELLEDSLFNIGDVLTRKCNIARDNRFDDDYFNGDGTSTYNSHTGLKNSTKVTSVNASGTAWTNVVYGDFLKAMGTLQGASWSNVQILCSRQFALQVLANLNIATSQFKNVFELSADKSGGMFLGTPVIFSQRMPIATASSTKFAYIGDFRSGSMVGERRDLTIKPDGVTGLSNDMFRWWVTGRYGVNICGHGRTDLTNQNIVALTTT